jgi:hypothetical protein
MTRPTLRWAVAVAVTIATFAMATWVCGAFVLPMRDGGARWGIAGGLGVAVAALAALWGHSYATAEHEQAEPEKAPPAAAGKSPSSFTIIGGTFHGPVTQAHDVGTIHLTSQGTSNPPPAAPPAVGNPPAEDRADD